jgi:hypothetical protein
MSRKINSHRRHGIRTHSMDNAQPTCYTTPMNAKTRTTVRGFRISDNGWKILTDLAARWGLSKTGVIELLLRLAYEQNLINVKLRPTESAVGDRAPPR